MLAVATVLCTFVLCTKARLVHKRPENGVGKLLVSHEESENSDEEFYFNERTLMITFNLECLDEEMSDVVGYNRKLLDSYARKHHQASKVDSIIDHFDGCLEHLPDDGHFKHFQHESKGLGVSFVNFVHKDGSGINCVNNHVNGSSFDYNSHCVHMFTYEPVFELNANNFGNGYTKFTNQNQYSCQTQNAGAAWGLDQSDSVTQDGFYTFPVVNSQNENGVDLHIIDSGVLDTHEEFYPGQVIHELGNGPSRYDPFGYVASHGTHVAGTAGGRNYGMSKNLTIYDYAVCVYSDYDAPSSSNDLPCYTNLIMTALDKVAARLEGNGGTRRGVVNLSLGGRRNFIDYLFEYYFNEIIKAGGIVTVSAGNDDHDACRNGPSFSSSAITVGAADSNLNKAYFSNYGTCTDVWAPGVNVISAVATSDTSYAYYDGTSMASPHMCGFVANLLLIDPTLTYNEVKTLLVESRQAPGISSVLITNDFCATYECVFPIYSCDTLPSNYTGSDYVEPTTTETIPQGPLISYPGFATFSCNTLAIALIDDTQSDPLNYNNYFVTEVAYEPTDICASWQTGSNIDISFSYVCVASDTVELTVWDGPACDSNLYTPTVVHTLYDGKIDELYWFGVNCDMVGPTQECHARVRRWYDENYYDAALYPSDPVSLTSMATKLFKSRYQNVNSAMKSLEEEDVDDNAAVGNAEENGFNGDPAVNALQSVTNLVTAGMNGLGSLIDIGKHLTDTGDIVLNAFYQSCTGFDTSTELYEDEIYTVGTCSDILAGQYSFRVSCTGSSIGFVYYYGRSCTGFIAFTEALTEGCYNDEGFYLEMMECAPNAVEAPPVLEPLACTIPSGVQYNMPVSDLVDAGWSLCYRQYYSTGLSDADLAACLGDGSANVYLFLGAIETQVSPSTFYMGAFAHAQTLLNDASTFGASQANIYDLGAWWYYAPGTSVGFSGSSSAISLTPCDTSSTSDNSRLCWNIGTGGYRAGNNINLNSDFFNFEKVAFYAKCDGNLTLAPSAPSQEPTERPTVQPTLPPVTPDTIQLTTTFFHTNWWYGMCFNVFSLTDEDVTVEQFDIICWSPGTLPITVKVFDPPGNENFEDYVDVGGTTGNYWTTIYSESSFYCSNAEQLFNLVLDVDNHVSIDPNGKKAFCIESGGSAGILGRSGYVFNSIFAQDGNVGIAAGAAYWNSLYHEDDVICTTLHYGLGPALGSPTSLPTVPTVDPTWMPTYVPSQPTASPTLPPDFTFVVGQFGVFEDTQEFGCTGSGCNIEKTWEIVGQCLNPRLQLFVIENDYSYFSEELFVYVNGVFIESCEPLDADGNYVFVECQFSSMAPEGGLILTPFIDENLKHSSQSLTLFLDSTDEVNCCQYNGYQVYVETVISCDLSGNHTYAPSSAPTDSPTVGAIPISYGDTYVGSTVGQPVIYPGGITSCGTSITTSGVLFVLQGEDGILTADTCALGTNYDSKISIFRGPDVNNLVCEGGNDDACSGLRSSVVITTYAGETYFILVHGFSSSTGTFVLTLTKQEPPTDQPSLMPTPWQPDYIFVVGEGAIFEDTEEFGCYGDSCSVTRHWSIQGQCVNPELSLFVIENDFSSSNEEALVYINGVFITSCEPLNDDGNYNFVQCQLSDTVLDPFIDETLKNSEQTLSITIDSTDEVNCCEYNGYQLYVKVVLNCDEIGNFTSEPTALPSRSPTVPTQQPIEPIDCSNIDVAQGVQYNIPVSTLSSFTPCYQEYYGVPTSDADLLSCAAGGAGNVIWFVGAIETLVSTSEFYMGAFVRAQDLLNDDSVYGSRLVDLYQNGVYWYYVEGSSVGYTESPDVQLNSCDTDGLNDNSRLCWHLGGNGGFRAGTNTWINSDMTNFQKVLYYAVCENATATTSAPTHERSECPVPGVELCESDKCLGYDSDGQLENPNCVETIAGKGCRTCADGYFREIMDIPCIDCNNIEGCLECKNGGGCARCDFGYARRWNSDCKFMTCVTDKPTTKYDKCTRPEIEFCESYRCTGTNSAGEDENPNCVDKRPWGCYACAPGYFREDFDIPCVPCDSIEGCLRCGGVRSTKGCAKCDTANGYELKWDWRCKFNVCEKP